MWSQLPGTGDPRPLAVMLDGASPTRVFLGGRGWQRDALPGRFRHLGYLPEAVTAVGAALAVG